MCLKGEKSIEICILYRYIDNFYCILLAKVRLQHLVVEGSSWRRISLDLKRNNFYFFPFIGIQRHSAALGGREIRMGDEKTVKERHPAAFCGIFPHLVS